MLLSKGQQRHPFFWGACAWIKKIEQMARFSFQFFCIMLNYKALFDMKKLEGECALTIQKILQCNWY